MSLNPRAIKEALAKQLTENIDREVTVRPFHTPPKAAFPYITMEEDHTEFSTFGPHTDSTYVIDLVLAIAANDPDNAEIALDDYRSMSVGRSSSIPDAIAADSTLGGAVASCVVGQISTPEWFEDGARVRFPLSIMTL